MKQSQNKEYMSMTITLTFTQCKQINVNTDLREFVEAINDQPDFMSGEMGIDSISELQSIIQCGCASNAHRSVYFYDAAKTMAEYGDSVLEYLENELGEIPQPEKGMTWSHLASHYLSYAIELWCGGFAGNLDGVDWD